MRHGFKAMAKRLALEVRGEIDLTADVPLDPWALAAEYGVEVISLSTLEVSGEAIEHFQVVKAEVFSGALIPCGTGARILENDCHGLVRRRSTLAHELAHLILEHPFSPTLVNERGCRSFDANLEAEASELAGELLIPAEAAGRLARRNASNLEAAEQFAVSEAVGRWRMDASGARLIETRRRAAYSRARRSR